MCELQDSVIYQLFLGETTIRDKIVGHFFHFLFFFDVKQWSEVYLSQLPIFHPCDGHVSLGLMAQLMIQWSLSVLSPGGLISFCSPSRHLTLAVAFSTKLYKRVLVNLHWTLLCSPPPQKKKPNKRRRVITYTDVPSFFHFVIKKHCVWWWDIKFISSLRLKTLTL